MAAQSLSAVLFDLDGTLIESDAVWDGAVSALAAERGANVAAEILAMTQGLASVDAMALVHDHLSWQGRDLAADVAWVEARVREIYLDQIRLRPGALTLIGRVRAARIPTGLVTSTNRPLVDLVLDTVGRDHFDVVVCGDDVRAPKPDPEPYLTAAARLGVPAGRCVAVEDSAPGATSARAAGCRVVLVGGLFGGPTGGPTGGFTGGLPAVNGDLVVESLVDVDVDMLARLVV